MKIVEWESAGGRVGHVVAGDKDPCPRVRELLAQGAEQVFVRSKMFNGTVRKRTAVDGRG